MTDTHTDSAVLEYFRQPLTSRYSPATVRAAAWAFLAYHKASRDLRSKGVETRVVAPPGSLPSGARRGVDAVLRRVRPTCLQRALVLQEWLRVHNVPCDVIIGSTAVQQNSRRMRGSTTRQPKNSHPNSRSSIVSRRGLAHAAERNVT